MNNPHIILGTRPEVIKMLPILRGFKSLGVDYTIISTGQQRDLLKQLMQFGCKYLMNYQLPKAQ